MSCRFGLLVVFVATLILTCSDSNNPKLIMHNEEDVTIKVAYLEAPTYMFVIQANDADSTYLKSQLTQN